MLIETLAALAVVTGASQEAAPYGGQERVAPRGDYSRSCSGAYVNRGRLYADCRTERGNVRGTSIELNRCADYEIQNRNGRLVCGPNRGDDEDRPGNGGGGDYDNGGGWGGGGRGSITVFRDADYRGASFRFDAAMPNLANTGFNDRISSMQFRGAWEACTDAYFGGRCQVFRDDVRNLQNWGFNDRISSLRPVRGGGRR